MLISSFGNLFPLESSRKDSSPKEDALSRAHSAHSQVGQEQPPLERAQTWQDSHSMGFLPRRQSAEEVLWKNMIPSQGLYFFSETL